MLKTQVAGVRFRCGRALFSEGRSVMAVEEEIGRVRDYFAHISVAGIDLTGKLKVGDTIHIHGHTTDITQVVDSMQIERVDVPEAGSGSSVGIKVVDRCRAGDHVFKVVE
jgi:translation initiation factor IF-2